MELKEEDGNYQRIFYRQKSDNSYEKCQFFDEEKTIETGSFSYVTYVPNSEIKISRLQYCLGVYEESQKGLFNFVIDNTEIGDKSKDVYLNYFKQVRNTNAFAKFVELMTKDLCEKITEETPVETKNNYEHQIIYVIDLCFRSFYFGFILKKAEELNGLTDEFEKKKIYNQESLEDMEEEIKEHYPGCFNFTKYVEDLLEISKRIKKEKGIDIFRRNEDMETIETEISEGYTNSDRKEESKETGIDKDTLYIYTQLVRYLSVLGTKVIHELFGKNIMGSNTFLKRLYVALDFSLYLLNKSFEEGKNSMKKIFSENRKIMTLISNVQRTYEILDECFGRNITIKKTRKVKNFKPKDFVKEDLDYLDTSLKTSEGSNKDSNEDEKAKTESGSDSLKDTVLLTEIHLRAPLYRYKNFFDDYNDGSETQKVTYAYNQLKKDIGEIKRVGDEKGIGDELIKEMSQEFMLFIFRLICKQPQITSDKFNDLKIYFTESLEGYFIEDYEKLQSDIGVIDCTTGICQERKEILERILEERKAAIVIIQRGLSGRLARKQLLQKKEGESSFKPQSASLSLESSTAGEAATAEEAAREGVPLGVDFGPGSSPPATSPAGETAAAKNNSSFFIKKKKKKVEVLYSKVSDGVEPTGEIVVETSPCLNDVCPNSNFIISFPKKNFELVSGKNFTLENVSKEHTTNISSDNIKVLPGIYFKFKILSTVLQLEQSTQYKITFHQGLFKNKETSKELGEFIFNFKTGVPSPPKLPQPTPPPLSPTPEQGASPTASSAATVATDTSSSTSSSSQEKGQGKEVTGSSTPAATPPPPPPEAGQQQITSPSAGTEQPLSPPPPSAEAPKLPAEETAALPPSPPPEFENKDEAIEHLNKNKKKYKIGNNRYISFTTTEKGGPNMIIVQMKGGDSELVTLNGEDIRNMILENYLFKEVKIGDSVLIKPRFTQTHKNFFTFTYEKKKISN